MTINIRERYESLKQLQSTLGPGQSADLSIEFLRQLPPQERSAALNELLDLMCADLAQHQVPIDAIREEVRKAFLNFVPSDLGGQGTRE